MKCSMTAQGLALALLLPAMAAAQTTNDDTSAAENWWDRVGAGFFSDAGLQTLRPEHEIRAHWTGLSADDQAAVRARCDEAAGQGGGTAASLQEGDEDEAPDTTEADRTDRAANDGASGTQVPGAGATTTTGSAGGAEVQEAAPSNRVEPYTGLAGGVEAGDASLVRVCALVARL